MEAVIDDPFGPGVVARAADGDEVAFARLVAAYHDDMVRVSFVICGDADVAQEAAQAAWTLAWRKLGSVREPARIRAWLVSVAANEAKGLARRRGRRSLRELVLDPETDTTPACSGDPATRAAEIDLANALARLDAADRMIVALRYGAGLTSEEIGRAIGMTAGGTRARIARVLQRLRLELNDD